MNDQIREYDFFVSYARVDNQAGMIKQFIDAIVDEHQKFNGHRTLTYFFDQERIPNFSAWETEIFQKHLVRSRLFLAFLSPAYFASEICRREWQAWIDREISLHILSEGAAPIYFIEIPGLYSKPLLTEQEVAKEIANLSQHESNHQFVDEVVPLIREFRRRQLVAHVVENQIQPFQHQGMTSLKKETLRHILEQLGRDLERRSLDVQLAAESENEVPAYNKNFTGRLDELVELRRMLTDQQTGVIAGIHGLGGIGKTELAFTFAHAFASAYPGGRFQIRCEHEHTLRNAMLQLGEFAVFRERITEQERQQPDSYFFAIVRCLKDRIRRLGHVLLILDNVSQQGVISSNQTDELTKLGPKLHVLATTRLLPKHDSNWLTLGELNPDEALKLLERFRPFANDLELESAKAIVKKLGGFTLAIELIAAALSTYPTATYSGFAENIGLDDLDTLSQDADIELRRFDHERKLGSVLTPTFASLTLQQMRTIEFAALLPPDQIPIPWLKALVTTEFPYLGTPDRMKGDLWENLIEQLIRIGIFTRVEQERSNRRVIRMHRLVQNLVVCRLTEKECESRLKSIASLIEERYRLILRSQDWRDIRWEIQALDDVAWLWSAKEDLISNNLMRATGTIWYRLGEWAKAEPLYRKLVDIHEKQSGSDHPETATFLNNLAQLLIKTNRHNEAESLLLRALAITERSNGSDHLKVAEILESLGLLQLNLGHFSEAENSFRRALPAYQNLAGYTEETGRIYSNLASTLQQAGRATEAVQYARIALRIAETMSSSNRHKIAIRLNNLGMMLKDLNQQTEAESLVRRALELNEQHFGDQHPSVAVNLVALGNILLDLNSLDEAEQFIRRAVIIDVHIYGENHPEVATDLASLADVLIAAKREPEAETLLRKVLVTEEQSFGLEYPKLSITLAKLARLLQIRQSFPEAEALLNRALAIDERTFGAEHRRVAIRLNSLVQLLQADNRLNEAEPLLSRVLQIYENSLEPSHPDIANAANNLAIVLQAMKRHSEAVPLMRRALEIIEVNYGTDAPQVVPQLNNLSALHKELKQYSEAELLTRRILAINERHLGSNHLHVAMDLKSLALLLQATNQLADAETMMRRHLEIFCNSTQITGSVHPHMKYAIANYWGILNSMGLSTAECIAKIQAAGADLKWAQ